MTTLKNILIVIATILWATACSSDILDEVPATNNNTEQTTGDASLSIRIASDAVVTRADATTETEQLADNEKKISSCVVAVFENNSNNIHEQYRIGYKYVDNNINQATDGSFTIQDIRCKEGNVKVVVIANLSEEAVSKLEGKYTYAEWREFSVKGIEVNNLVKFNEGKPLTLKSGENSVVIPLTQLAARVDISEISVTTPTDEMTASFEMAGMTATICDYSYVLSSYPFTDNTSSYNNQYTTDKTYNISKDAYVSFYSYSVASGTGTSEKDGAKDFVKITMTGVLNTTIGEVTESRNVTFTFPIQKNLYAGNLYRGNLIISSGLELVSLDLQTIPWVKKDIDVSLK